MLKLLLAVSGIIAVLGAFVLSVLLCIAETHISGEEDNDSGENDNNH